MPPEHDLDVMLRTLAPDLRPGRWVFASTGTTPTADLLEASAPVVTVSEPEGTTLVVDVERAHALDLDHDGVVMRMITLRVHSALDAVGLTAAVSSALAAEGISCNMVAGRHHDHLFVPEACADDAVRILGRWSEDSPRATAAPPPPSP